MYSESSVSLRSSGGNMGAVAVDGYAESRIQSDVDGKMPNISLSQSVYSRWTFKHNGAESCLAISLGTTVQSHLESGSYVGWKSKETKTFVQELAKAIEKQCIAGDSKTRRDSIERRQLVNPNFDLDLYLRSNGADYSLTSRETSCISLARSSWIRPAPICNSQQLVLGIRSAHGDLSETYILGISPLYIAYTFITWEQTRKM
ncbi:hypothetical protein PMG11_06429 [Penicillium brasilianum]|uniref:Uncharacterized protein n=1 Tax=Penicillium brasilianum TaxID=104259 RepID=A0A0F7TRU7_PENBI|nr:hypothetical protein PMG11_06429 [Penicillium brasilianum]